MKILDIASTDIGAYRLLKNRVKLVNQLGEFDNIILCPNGKWRKMIEKDGIKTIEYKFTRGISLLNIIKEIKLLMSILKNEKPDIVHSHNSKSGAIARIAVKLVNINCKNKIKCIHQVHGYHFTLYSDIRRIIYISIEFILSQCTDLLLFQNKYEYELAKKYKMDKRAKLEYIGNGIDLDEIKNVETISNKESNKCQLVCVARVEPVKNHIMLVKAINVLINKYNMRNLEVICVGEGNDEEVSKYIEENKLDKYIKFTGVSTKEEVLRTIKKSKLLILTSKKEGKPRAIMEAMSLGVPCIGTRVIGTSETIFDDETGYLVTLDDHCELALKINKLINDEELYNKFSYNSREYSKKMFDEKVIVQKIIDIYRSCF